MAGPLAGVRILDCTTVVLGPWAAQQLGDLGADVIKIEPPEGDTTRLLGPARHPGMAAFYLGCNRSKRSIVLDLKQEAGRKALFKLAETADVLMHNYRPEPARAAGRGVREVREDQSAAGLSRDLRLPLGRPAGTEGGLRRHHPGGLGPRLAADRGSGPAALPADHRRRQDQLQRRRLGAARGSLRAGEDRPGPGGRGADVRDAGLVRHGRASLRRDLQTGARHRRLQARAEQGAPALSVEGRLLRPAALHRRPLEGVLHPGRPARSRQGRRASRASPTGSRTSSSTTPRWPRSAPSAPTPNGSSS